MQQDAAGAAAAGERRAGCAVRQASSSIPALSGETSGGKGDFMDVALCYVLSQRSGGPVKMIMDSGEEFVAGNPRHAGVIRVKTGVEPGTVSS